VVQPRLRARFIAGTVVAIAAIASIGGGVALAADHAVAISGFAFSPKDVTVTVGDTITWTNSDATAHTATADDGSFDTGTIGANGTGTATFSTAGSFPYHCKIHSSMTGTITVVAAAGGSGSGATSPPSDTDPAIATPAEIPLGSLLAVVGAGLAAFVLARRRFARD
jgi:plastocyanin